MSRYDLSRNPDFSKYKGISYTLAKNLIKKSVDQAILDRWNKTETTLKQYKTTLQRTPYLDIGTAFEIRFRTRCMIGTDDLNFTLHRFGRGAAKPDCPQCKNKHETVDHFLTKCTLYTNIRKQLYFKFCEVYPNRERPFTHIGLLREPTTRNSIQKHRPVIVAVNQFITEAWRLRLNYIHQKSLKAPSQV